MDIQDTIRQEGESKSIPEISKIPRPKKHKKHPYPHKKYQGKDSQIKSIILSKDSIQAIKDSKKMNKPKKDSKPVEVIDKDRFNSLKAVFEKKEDKSKAEEVKPNRLSFDILSTFTNKENTKTNDNSQDKTAQGHGGLSEGIKKRMHNLFNSNKNTNKPSGYVDPILDNIKIRASSERNEVEEDFEDEEFDDDNVFCSENSSFDSEEDEQIQNETLNAENDLNKKEKEENIEDLKKDKKDASENVKKCIQNEENVKEENSVVNKVPKFGIDEDRPIFQKNPNIYRHENKNYITEDSNKFNTKM